MEDEVQSELVEAHAQLLVRCAWCERVHAGGSAWVEPAADAMSRAIAAGTLTHGICPTCFASRAPQGVSYPV